MPVLSPHRSSTSGLAGSYRSTSSILDRPYYVSSAYAPRISSYNERFSTRAYTDSDGRKVFSRSGSITEDGVTTRFHEESRENSLRRDSLSGDSGIGSMRDSLSLRRERDSSVNRYDNGRESRLNSLSAAETLAEIRNKYSPANYVPAIHRKNDISRSKSINDIGLPPIEKYENGTFKKKVIDSLNFNNSLVVTSLSNNTNKEQYGKEEHNKGGYSKEGYSKEGYSKEGFSKEGYSKEGYGKEGYSKEGYRKEPCRKEPSSKETYSKEAYSKEVHNKEACNKEPINKEQYNKEQLNKEQINKEQLNKEQFNKEQYNKEQYNKEHCNKEQYNKEYNNKELYNKEQYNKEHNNKEQYSKDHLKKEQFNKEQLNKGNKELLNKGNETTYDDDNENIPSFSEIRKRFDEQIKANSTNSLVESSFRKEDYAKRDTASLPKKISAGASNDAKNALTTNGLTINGFTTNGFTTNGFSINGFTSNGFTTHGPTSNGFTTNGLTTNGLTKNGEVTEKRPAKLSKFDDKFNKKQADIRNSDTDLKCSSNNSINFDQPKLKVPKKPEATINNGSELRGSSNNINFNSHSQSTSPAEHMRSNNYSSYNSTKILNKGDSKSEDSSLESKSTLSKDHDMDNRKVRSNRYNDVTSSPRFGRASLTSSNAGPSNASTSSKTNQRNSVDRDDDKSYDRIQNSPVKHQGLNGLKNIGNTCFMNSVIQCLSNTKQLLEYVRKDLYINDINTTISGMKGALIKAFSQVIKELWSEDPGDRVVNTVSLKSQIQRFAPRFMGYAQQDAQEFLRYLLEGLHEDVNRVSSKPTPILTEIEERLSDSEKSAESWQRYLRMDNSKIVDLFVGQLKSTLKCTHCGHCSVTFDPFWDLSLPIPQKSGPVRLSQCLEYFTREETMDGDEKPTCAKCEERRKCTKSFSIQKFPKILVIHIKRFSPTERYRGKLSQTVDFPLEGLDMRNYAADSAVDCRYNLYAISNHSGTTYSGHYTAYCRHPYSHIWHMYNDSRVSPISPSSIVSGEAYVLFYEQESKKAHL